MFSEASKGEKKMRVKSLLAAAVLVSGAQFASAANIVVTGGDYTITDVLVPSGGGAGNEVHQFYAKLNPTGPDAAATGTQSVDLEMSIIQAFSPAGASFKFNQSDIDQDGVMDIAVNGQGISDAVARTGTTANVATFIRAGNPSAGAFFDASTNPPYLSVDADGDGIADTGKDAVVNYANNKDFRVTGIIQGGKDPKAISDPLGALFAVAVVPTGTKINLTGSIAADSGPITPFTLSEVVPEPTALGFIGLAGLALARRRRQA
jgi:hypothetical protein